MYINCGTFSVWHIHYNCASMKAFEADPPWLTGAYPKLTAQLQNVNVRNKEEIWTFGMEQPSAATTIYFIWLSIQYNTIQLYCLCVEKFAFWLIIYIKTFNTVNNKTSTTQWNTELKTAQIQGKYLTITMYTHTHTRMHAPAHPPTHIIFLAHQ